MEVMMIESFDSFMMLFSIRAVSMMSKEPTSEAVTRALRIEPGTVPLHNPRLMPSFV